MSINIVLFEPLIPQNTGNIARLTAANFLTLHLIEPLGFDLSDRYMKRAGLDYWEEVSLKVHSSWDAFLSCDDAKNGRILLLTTKGAKSIYETKFKENDVLVFGNESHGFPEFMHEKYTEDRILIPMKNKNIRSLNLSNAVSIACFEALRQTEHIVD
jgi:tRNA (cytidine/uridine-2'-O-)-methyltransferase